MDKREKYQDSLERNALEQLYVATSGYIVGKQVTLNQDLVTGSVHVIVDGAETSLVVDGAEMVIVGTLDLTKETEGYPGNVQVVNGGRIIPKAP